jgi:hypothetical protein
MKKTMGIMGKAFKSNKGKMWTGSAGEKAAEMGLKVGKKK